METNRKKPPRPLPWRLGGALVVLLLIAACAAPSEEPAASGETAPTLDWRTKLTDDVIEVTLTDRKSAYRVERIVLLDADDRTHPAFEVNRATDTDHGWGASGGTSS